MCADPDAFTLREHTAAPVAWQSLALSRSCFACWNESDTKSVSPGTAATTNRYPSDKVGRIWRKPVPIRATL